MPLKITGRRSVGWCAWLVCAWTWGWSANLLAQTDDDALPPEAETEAADEEEADVGGKWKTILRGLFGQDILESEAKKGRNTSAPVDPKAVGLLQRAKKAVQKKDDALAVELVRALLAEPEDSLYEVAPGRLESVRLAAQQLLLKLPEDALRRYRLQAAGEAEAAWQQARGTGSLSAISEVALRFQLTDAGQAAADWLIGRHLDRGEYVLAARWCQLLLAVDAPCTQQRIWQTRARYIAKVLNDHDLLKKLPGGPEELEAELKLAGRSTTWQKFEASLRLPPLQSLPVLRDWPTLFGTPQRWATVDAGEPLLLQRWYQPLTNREPLQALLRELVESQRDEHVQAISELQALFVQDKLVLRSLRGIRALDPKTGHCLWETEADVNAEELFTPVAASAEADDSSSLGAFGEVQMRLLQFGLAGRGLEGEEGEEEAQQSSLERLLYRDSNYCLSGSDGQRLYVLEEFALADGESDPFSSFSDDLENESFDRYGLPRGVNRLAAYDLESGRRLWQVGGPELQDEFAPPLNGTFFFGPPVADGGELLVVGEREREIRLFVLSAETGELIWTQRLAQPRAPITRDRVRRQLVAPVAIHDGIVICPTTAGWIVAVDRSARSLLWAAPVVNNTELDREDSEGGMLEEQTLGVRWASSPPMIVRQKVLVAPPEGKDLFCFQLTTGKLLWKAEKGDDLYLAGATDDKVLTVSPRRVLARDLTTGRSQWKHTLPEGVAPAGRGLLTADKFYLPENDGTLVTLDMQEGKVLRRQEAAPADLLAHGPLGNLTYHDGLWYSIGPMGVTAFEDREQFETDLAQHENEPDFLLRRGALAIVQKDYAQANQLLESVPTQNLSAEQQSELNQRRWTAWLGLVKSDLRAQDDAFLQLTQHAQTDAQRWLVRQLEIERHLAREDYETAASVLWNWSQEPVETQWLVDQEQRRRTRTDVWLAVEWARIWPKLTAAQQAGWEERLRSVVAQLGERTPAERERWLRIYAFHPLTLDWDLSFCEAEKQAGHTATVELRLLRLQLRNASYAPRANALLADLYAVAGYPTDAAAVYRQLEQAGVDATLPDGTQLKDALQKWRAGPHGTIAGYQHPIWHQTPLQLQRYGSSYEGRENIQALTFGGGTLPYYQMHRVEFDPESQRLQVVHAATEKYAWSIPLAGSDFEVAGYTRISAQPVGHALIARHHALLCAVSPWTQEVLWRHPIEPQWPGYEDNFSSGDTSQISRGHQLQSLSRSKLLDRLNETPLGVNVFLANAERLVVSSHHKLLALDALTGEELWSREGVPLQAGIYGGNDNLYLLRPGPGGARLLQVADGRELTVPKLTEQVRQTVFVSDDYLLQVLPSQAQGTGSSKLQTWRAYQPVTEAVAWSVDLPVETRGTLLPGRRFLMVLPTGEVRLMDLSDGTVRELGQLPSAERRSNMELLALTTAHTLLLAVNDRHRAYNNFFPEEIPGMWCRGQLHAFDLEAGKERWRKEISSQFLMTPQLEYSPAVVLAGRSFKQQAFDGQWNLHLQILDWNQGTDLLKQQMPVQIGFHQFAVNLPNNFVEFRSYNERLRIHPKEKE